MKILVIGDIFSRQGRKALVNELPKLKKQEKIDFVIANAENATHGRGLSKRHYNEIIAAGVDCITMGNHTWDNPEIFEIFETCDRIIRPYNIDLKNEFSKKGKGSSIFVINKIAIRITNLLGLSINMNGLQSNPFEALDEIVKQNDALIHIVDFHAETTAEKNALFLDFSSKVNLIYGTHTHVPTNDARIFNNTAYQTDLGMCGALNSVIGAQPDSIIARFRDPSKSFRLIPSEENYIFCSSLVEFDDSTGNPINIKPIVIYEK